VESKLTTFAAHSEFEKARRALVEVRLPYEVISPDPGYARVGAAALAIGSDARRVLATRTGADLLCAGWVDYRPAEIEVPRAEPPEFEEDVFGRAAIVVLAKIVQAVGVDG